MKSTATQSSNELLRPDRMTGYQDNMITKQHTQYKMGIFRPEQNEILQSTFLNASNASLKENCCILILISLKFVPGGTNDIKSAMFQVMAWCHHALNIISYPLFADADTGIHPHAASQ